MHIPEYRRAINGRTWPQEWTPHAIEHHRVGRISRWHRVAGWALAIFVGVSMGILLAS